jgi:hypothetical protein
MPAGFGVVKSQVFSSSGKGVAARPVPPKGWNDCENRVSGNLPSFAVAMN